MRWSLVMPVKGAAGKRRLHAGDARSALAVAFARDAVAAAIAARAVERVVVVTGDPLLAATLDSEHVADPGTGLHGAIEAGLTSLDPDEPGAVLLGDLPALTPAALDAGLDLAAAEERSFVADAIGFGTTLLAARRARDLRPGFGTGSALRHRDAGHVELRVPLDSPLRRDVDELADLSAAIELGVGPHTQAVLAAAHAAA